MSRSGFAELGAGGFVQGQRAQSTIPFVSDFQDTWRNRKVGLDTIEAGRSKNQICGSQKC